MDSKLFPGLESRALDNRLDGYIAKSSDDVNIVTADASVRDKMITALSLYYTFRDIVIRMANEPARLEIAEAGAHTYNAQQLETMKELRDGYLAEYNGLVVPVPTTSTSSLPGTRTARTRQIW